MTELNGRPLLDTRLDQSLYVARPDVEEPLTGAVARGLNALLLGPRGSGKTTILRHLAYALRAAGTPVTFVEGAAAEDARAFLELVARRLGDREEARRPAVDGAARALIDLVHALAPSAGKERRVVLVDGLPSPDDAHTIFGRLRDEVWQLPITWIVAADERARAGYLTPPADAFFDLVVEVPPLTERQREELLRSRLGDSSGSETLAVEGPGNPRELLALARELATSDASPRALLEARSARRHEGARLGAPAEMLMAELEALGPASASDERLLRRLGWTRARAVQVFKQLEQAGIVTASEQRGRAGRPRKIYALRPSGERT
jgi:energy-coupling factor transporter ATP-binding protein EcfA2